MLLRSVLFSIASVLVSTASAFDATSKSNLVVYWGQASAGSQESLATYCDSDDVDLVVLSFMSSFPGTNNVPTLNFASSCTDSFSDGLLKCDQIATDIKTCQSKGKKVLLSLGGSAGSYGFTSDSEAETFAESLWNYFGEGTSSERPFGDSVIDGFDVDIENNNPVGYAAMANKLRELYANGTKQYYISASPQCVYPDAGVGEMLDSSNIDFAFIQFYNNYCNVDKTFNWDTWLDFAENVSPNKDIKLYLGLPSSQTAAGSGYIDMDLIKSTVESISSSSYFGGISTWDASQAFTNEIDGETWAHLAKEVLEDVAGSASTGAETSSAAASAAVSTAAETSSTAAETSSTAAETSSTATETSSTAAETSTAAPVSTSSEVPAQTAATSTAETTSPETTSTETTPAVTSTAETTPAETEPTTAPEVTTNTFTSGPSGFTTLTVSTENKGASPDTSATVPAVDTTTTPTTLALAPTTTPGTTTPAAAASTPATTTTLQPDATTTSATTTASSAAATSDCSSLTGLSKAQCLNTQFEAGDFLGSSSTCTHGAIACSASGEFAICNWGEWVTTACASTTSCYAYNQGDSVFVGCNYDSEKSSFLSKRSLGHSHHAHVV